MLNKAESAKKYQKLLKRDILIIENGNNYDEFVSFTNKHPIFVKKKIFSSMGKGVELVDINSKQIDSFYKELVSNGKWLLEECVCQKEEMSQFNDSSVNTVRCITFKTKYGVIVPYCFMRTGRKGSFVDNGGSGGLLIGIDVNSGIADTDAFNEYGGEFEYHPDSGIRFRGFEVPEWTQLINICKTAAEEEQQMNYLSWDMAYGEQGWVVIEVNEVGQFIGPQMVYQKGIKAELEDYLKQMSKVI